MNSYLDEISDNLGDFREEQGERFHQDINVMEIRYQGRWEVLMKPDSCWTLKRETTKENRKRKALHRSFNEKRTRNSSKKDTDC